MLTNLPPDLHRVEILGMNGQLIQAIAADRTSVSLDISSLESGLYLIRTLSGQGSEVHRLVKH